MPLLGYDKTAEPWYLQTPPVAQEYLRDALDRVIGIIIVTGTRSFVWEWFEGEWRLIQVN